MNLSSRSEDAGRYFASIAEHRLGLGGFDRSLFEELANRSSEPIRAASSLALGIEAISLGKIDDALRFYEESHRLSSKQPASITYLHTTFAISELLSMKGDHKESLAILKTVHPVVCHWGRVFPLLIGEQYNNIAYELFKTGDLAPAQYAINKACGLPIASVYPEWFQTKQEIEEKLNEKPSRHQVFAPSQEQTEEPEDFEAPAFDLLRPARILPFHRARIDLWCKYKNQLSLLHEFLFGGQRPTAPAEAAFLALIDKVEKLTREQAKSFSIIVYIRLFDSERLKNDHATTISESAIPALFQCLIDLRGEIAIEGAIADESVKEDFLDDATVIMQTERILAMIDEDEDEEKKLGSVS